MEKLTGALWHYTSPTSNIYDKEFTETLHKLRLDWKVVKPKKVVVERVERPVRVNPQILGVELDTEWPRIRVQDLDGSWINPCWHLFKDGNEGPHKYKLDALMATINYTLSKENLLGKMPLNWEQDYEKNKILQILKSRKPISKMDAAWLQSHISLYTNPKYRKRYYDKDFADKVSKIYRKPKIIGKTRVCNKVHTSPEWAERMWARNS